MTNNLWTFKFPKDAMLSFTATPNYQQLTRVITTATDSDSRSIELQIYADSYADAIEALNRHVVWVDQPVKPAVEDPQYLLQVNQTLKNILTTLIESSTLHRMAHDSRGIHSDDYVKSVDELHGKVLEAVAQVLKHVSAMPSK